MTDEQLDPAVLGERLVDEVAPIFARYLEMAKELPPQQQERVFMSAAEGLQEKMAEMLPEAHPPHPGLEELLDAERDSYEAMSPADDWEQHGTPFHPPVVGFRRGSAMRAVYEQFWQPEVSVESDSAPGMMSNERSKLWLALRDIRPAYCRELWPAPDLDGGPPPKKKAKVIIDYPLHQPMEREVMLDLSRPGEIFGVAFDMYEAAYDADDAGGGGARIPGMQNRAPGPMVWGHDIDDLVFEHVLWKPEDDPDSIGTFRFGIGS